jgi:hypothetical protein
MRSFNNLRIKNSPDPGLSFLKCPDLCSVLTSDIQFVEPNNPLARVPVLEQNFFGMINENYCLSSGHGREAFLTVFQRKSPQQLDPILYLLHRDTTGLLPRLLFPEVVDVEGKSAILSNHVRGCHYVEIDHSKKAPLTLEAHHSVVQSFIDLHTFFKHTELPDFSSLVTGSLYSDVETKKYLNLNYDQLPRYLQQDFIKRYVQHTVELETDSICHTDFERQNLIHNPNTGQVRSVVDIDAIGRGDINFECAHMLFNFLFLDPSYSTGKRDMYLHHLINSHLNIDLGKVFEYVPIFAAIDLLLFYKEDYSSIEDLAKQYQTGVDKCLQYPLQ